MGVPTTRPSLDLDLLGDFGHFGGTFCQFTGIFLSSFVPTFPQLWAPRGRRPQLDPKNAHHPGMPMRNAWSVSKVDVFGDKYY